MSIVTVSRNIYSKGLAIARRLSRELGYACVSHEILRDASRRFGIAESRLRRALHDPPPGHERIDPLRDRAITCVRAALLDRLQSDNVVYCGLAGHFFLRGVPHVLKVRVVAGLESRVREAMRREHLSADEAWRVLSKDDAARRRWSLALHGIETWDASLYDLVLNVETLRVPDVVRLVAQTLRLPAFRSSAASRQVLAELALGARVEAALRAQLPISSVRAQGRSVEVVLPSPLGRSVLDEIHRIAADQPGVRSVSVCVRTNANGVEPWHA